MFNTEFTTSLPILTCVFRSQTYTGTLMTTMETGGLDSHKTWFNIPFHFEMSEPSQEHNG